MSDQGNTDKGLDGDQLIIDINRQTQNKNILSDVNTYEDLFDFFDDDGKLQVVPSGGPAGWMLMGSAATPEDEDHFFDMIDQISFRILEDSGEANFYEPFENDGCGA